MTMPDHTPKPPPARRSFLARIITGALLAVPFLAPRRAAAATLAKDSTLLGATSVPSGASLTISSGATLAVADGATVSGIAKPLKYSSTVITQLLAGDNITLTPGANGVLTIAATASGGGGSGITAEGGAITSIIAGDNITLTRSAGGALTIASTGGDSDTVAPAAHYAVFELPLGIFDRSKTDFELKGSVNNFTGLAQDALCYFFGSQYGNQQSTHGRIGLTERVFYTDDLGGAAADADHGEARKWREMDFAKSLHEQRATSVSAIGGVLVVVPCAPLNPQIREDNAALRFVWQRVSAAGMEEVWQPVTPRWCRYAPAGAPPDIPPPSGEGGGDSQWVTYYERRCFAEDTTLGATARIVAELIGRGHAGRTLFYRVRRSADGETTYQHLHTFTASGIDAWEFSLDSTPASDPTSQKYTWEYLLRWQGSPADAEAWREATWRVSLTTPDRILFGGALVRRWFDPTNGAHPTTLTNWDYSEFISA
ncbi:MAG: hypothetical protein LBC18_13675 [Opitutaceae bacterium]|jgi:hypothetical protein|nr:hypothetical protein [Opitutaceae bacterium]